MGSDSTHGSSPPMAIDYEARVQAALRQVVYDVLKEAESNGLPGDHHFYITFKTQFQGVNIPARLVERYPDEMTVVLQHKYWGLEVLEDLFRVQLSFDRQQELLQIPLAAITGFADPSVKFALQFPEDDMDDTDMDDAGLEQDLPESAGIHDGYFIAEHELAKMEAERREKGDDSDTQDQSGDGDNVVTLDTFRKK